MAALPQNADDSLYRNYLYDSRTTYFRQLPPKKGAVVFWGDSITDWGDWAEFTGNASAINRGIAGDNTYGLLHRTDEVTRHQPKKLFILIGTNDLNIHIPLEQRLVNYDSIIDRVKRESPNTIIYVQSVLPINNDLISRQYYSGTNEAIRLMNSSLDSLARTGGVVYVDLYSHFLDQKGQLDAKYTYDGLHLNGVGYMRWIGILEKNKFLDTDTTIEERLIRAHQGEVITLPGFFDRPVPALPYKKLAEPGVRLIISDDPEYIHAPESIALQEKVTPGKLRLYLYNVNGVDKPRKMPRKITAVIKNTGSGTMHLRMLRYSSQPPSANYYYIGKQGLADYFASRGKDETVSVAPGAVVSIDTALERRTENYDDLAHGIYEFSIDQPGEVSVLQTSPEVPGPVALGRIRDIIPPSHVNAGRGLFDVCNYSVRNDGVIDTKNGPVSLTVADGLSDPWLKGKEGSTGQQVENAGNYGVIYHIRLRWKSTDGRVLALLTWNPASRNGQWCGGMANTMVVGSGKFKGGIQQLPSDRLVTGGSPECIFVQLFPPAAGGKEQTIELTYSPPGASCLPTPLVLVPVRE